MSSSRYAPPKNPNYCATVVALPPLTSLATLDNLRAAKILGSQVLIGKEHLEGELGLYFPVECALSAELLTLNNLYSSTALNSSPVAPKGYFEPHGRVRAIRLRGHRSEGLWLPMSVLTNIGIDPSFIEIGAEFDTIDGVVLCSKYAPRRNPSRLAHNVPKSCGPRLEDRICAEQFHLHYDTENLRRCIVQLNPSDMLSITEKWHGTSVVVANCLTKPVQRWYDFALGWLGIIRPPQYGIVWSSRKVVKGVGGEAKTTARHFYSEDVWGVAALRIAGTLPAGYTVYGELVGQTPSGADIQQGYTYGVPAGTCELRVYRVTCTNADGEVLELAYPQMIEWCARKGLLPVVHLWYGRASELARRHPDQTHQEWAEGLLGVLEQRYILNRNCPHNTTGVPEEGIVVRRDTTTLRSEAWKLKNFAFLEWETKQLDKEVVDMENPDSEEQNAAR